MNNEYCRECDTQYDSDYQSCNCEGTVDSSLNEARPRVDDLAQLIRRLIRQVRKHDAKNAVAYAAEDYLQRKQLKPGSILRDGQPAPTLTRPPEK